MLGTVGQRVILKGFKLTHLRSSAGKTMLLAVWRCQPTQGGGEEWMVQLGVLFLMGKCVAVLFLGTMTVEEWCSKMAI